MLFNPRKYLDEQEVFKLASGQGYKVDDEWLAPLKQRIDIYTKHQDTMTCAYREFGSPLPKKQEEQLLEIFNVLMRCTYDSAGLNKDWKNMKIEHKSELRKFIKEVHFHFRQLRSDQLEDMCRKIRAN